MELRDYLNLGLRWLWLFALATAVAAVGAYLATRQLPKQYMSQSTLMVGRSTKSTDPDWSDVYLSQSLAQTYAQMATRERVLRAVVEELGLGGSWGALRGMVKAVPVAGTALLEVRVVDSDPLRAQAIADAVANQVIAISPRPIAPEDRENQEFVQRQTETLRAQIDDANDELKEIDGEIALASSARAIADLEARRAARTTQIQAWREQFATLLASVEGGEVNSLAVVEAASPGSQVGPNVGMNVLLAALLGFGIALLAVLAIEYLDDTVKTTEVVEKRLGVTGLATVNLMEGIEHKRDGLVTLNQPRSPVAESYRVLRTNLKFAFLTKPSRVLLVTSASPGEGKSTTAANVAVATAQSGQRVVLVDGDLRRPSLHRFFGMSNSTGLTTLLIDDKLRAEDVMQQADGVEGLAVVTSGALPPNPAEVLESPRVRALIDELKASADLVVIDGPPLLVVTDGAIMAGLADATLLVCDSGSTRFDAARRAIEALERVGVKPVGVVINKLEPQRVGRYYYYYRYRYRYDHYYSSSGDSDRGAGGSSGSRRRSAPATASARLVERIRQGISSLL